MAAIKASPVASSDGLFWHLLLSAGDIADDLGPQPALRPASDSDEPVDRGAVGVEELEDLPNAKADAFIDRTEQVTALVLQRQPSDDPTGAWIKDRGAFASEVWQHEEATRAGRDRGSVVDKIGEGEAADEVLDP
jgi:hypothetical protein